MTRMEKFLKKKKKKKNLAWKNYVVQMYNM